MARVHGAVKCHIDYYVGVGHCACVGVVLRVVYVPINLSRLVARALNASSIGAARRAAAAQLLQDPSNMHANTLLSVLGCLPMGEILATNVDTSANYALYKGPKDQITSCALTNAAWKRAETYAGSLAPVLILGESGTGKEAIARMLHDISPRAAKPFVAINCGGFTETLVESELFGYEKGAFTGAQSMKRGSLESAGDGTVFLDEIGELPLAVQVRLLRVLEDKTFRRVGGDGANPIAFRGRVVAATHRDLPKLINAGTFREDLYYRIAVLELRTVPLRLRIEDALMLASAWLSPLTLSDAAIDVLRNRPWNGNIRELRNVCERAKLHAMADGRTQVLATDW